MPPKSNKERQREFRKRRNQDPEKRQAYLKERRDKYKEDVKAKKRKPIADMSEREQRRQRKEWRKNKREERKRRKVVTPDTPPLSPETEPSSSVNKERGRKKVKRDRAKCYRENRMLQNALESEKKAADRYRKKYERLLKKMKSADGTMKGTPSPRSKTRKLLKYWSQSNEKKKVAKTLNFHYSILSDFKHRLRPFFVVEPTEQDRETCQCKLHENFQFMATALKKVNILNTDNLDDICDQFMCQSYSKSCAYNSCPRCKDRRYNIDYGECKESDEITYIQWGVKKVPHPDSDISEDTADKTMTIVVKEQIKSNLSDLVGEFNEKALQFKQHRFNIWNQYKVYKLIKEQLKEGECLCHIDFSENYVCKCSDEVQSMHFGGSHQQASLHTGIYYTQDGVFPFCSISASRQHDPPAIWAHMGPILKKLREQNIKVLHMFSDGPVTQYKQKGNFYYICHEPFNLGFKCISWHFFEASHGKGAPDGIGGTLKRTANRLVRLGKDIKDARDLYNQLSENDSSVKLFYIENNEVKRRTDELQALGILPTIKGTMKIHQVVSIDKGRLEYRDVSCVCSMKDNVLNCPCFEPKNFEIHVPSQAVPNSLLIKPFKFTRDHENSFCVVIYDEKLYPGRILEVTRDREVKVDCMKPIGRNRFVWPTQRKDICIYPEKEVLCLIPELIYHDGRRPYFVINQEVWREIEDRYLDMYS